MVKRMIRRGLLLSPVVVAVVAAFGGVEWALSAAIGLGLALANLWLAGRLIGGMAENRPELMAAAAFGAFILGLGLLTVAAIVLKRIESLDFPVTGVVLIGAHLVLVIWEAADAFLKLPPKETEIAVSAKTTRS